MITHQPQHREKKSFRGGGIEFPHEFDQEPFLSDALDRAQVVEIIPEGFFHGKRSNLLRELNRRSIPVLVHSVEMSLGTEEPLRTNHIDQILWVCDQVNAIALSDHICMTRAGGVDIGQLTSLAYTEESLDILCRNIERLQGYLGSHGISLPLMLENITHRFKVPHNTLGESEFILKMALRTGVGILLDVTNLYINSTNFGFDPKVYLKPLIGTDAPPNLIQGIHLAGGEWEDDKLYDTHSQKTHPEVWDLFRSIIQKTDPEVIIVEWDQDPPSVEALYQEVDKALALRWEERSLTRKSPQEISLFQNPHQVLQP